MSNYKKQFKALEDKLAGINTKKGFVNYEQYIEKHPKSGQNPTDFIVSEETRAKHPELAKKLEEIDKLVNEVTSPKKVAGPDYKTYKQEHPGTKKTPSDPMFKEVPDINSGVYRHSQQWPKFNSQVNPLNAYGEGHKMLRQRLPDYTKEDHNNAAEHHKKQKADKEKQWNDLLDDAHKKTFGKERTIFDYQISGIGKNEYPEEVKNKARTLAQEASAHGSAAKAHEDAAKYLRKPRYSALVKELETRLAIKGPRGGEIIGHTKSGKPIYESGNKGAKGWSPQDHRDAYHAHEKKSWHHEDTIEPIKSAMRDKNPGGSITDFHTHLEHGHGGAEAQHHAQRATHHRMMMEQHYPKFKGKNTVQ